VGTAALVSAGSAAGSGERAPKRQAVEAAAPAPASAAHLAASGAPAAGSAFAAGAARHGAGAAAGELASVWVLQGSVRQRVQVSAATTAAELLEAAAAAFAAPGADASALAVGSKLVALGAGAGQRLVLASDSGGAGGGTVTLGEAGVKNDSTLLLVTPQVHGWRVRVKLANKEDTIELPCQPGDSVGSLKAQLASHRAPAWRIEEARQRLFFGGKQLSNAAVTLQAVGVKDGACIILNPVAK
jgi:hypothetical protein